MIDEKLEIVRCENGVGEWEISSIHETFDTREEAEKYLKNMNGIDNLEQEILSALKINRDVNWIEHDANDEFDNLITFVKTLFSRYRGQS